MTDVPQVIGLLHRADWTRLSMRAEVSDGSTVLIAPGRRYREQTGEFVRGCDGSRIWELSLDTHHEDVADRVDLVGGPKPPLRLLLCPAWLLTDSRLEVRERAQAAGREALRVVVTRRPRDLGGATPGDPVPEQVEVLVDAELGIVLRLARQAGGQPVEVTELIALELGPTVDPAQFEPPPGSLIGKSWSEAFPHGVPVWQTVAGVAAGGLGAWIKYSPFRASSPQDGEDTEAAIPPTSPAPEVSPEGWPAGPAVPDDVLRRLHDSGTADFAAQLHEWIDIGAMLARLPAGVRRAGFGGVGLLADAISERPATAHVVSAVRVAGPDKYRIERIMGPRHGPEAVICDGQRRWQVYPGRITAGPARPLDIAGLIDTSWLLECRLSGGTQMTAGDRPAYRLDVARGDARPPPLLFPATTAVAVLDAELGILLQLTCYLGGQPVHHYQMREVSTQATAFRVHIPSGLPITEERSPVQHAMGTAVSAAGVVLGAASAVTRQAAAEAVKAARNFLRRRG